MLELISSFLNIILNDGHRTRFFSIATLLHAKSTLAFYLNSCCRKPLCFLRGFLYHFCRYTTILQLEGDGIQMLNSAIFSTPFHEPPLFSLRLVKILNSQASPKIILFFDHFLEEAFAKLKGTSP